MSKGGEGGGPYHFVLLVHHFFVLPNNITSGYFTIVHDVVFRLFFFFTILEMIPHQHVVR